ncbi:MAG: hypothetical protein AYP45_15640 [Candidatus Brocadia carolinensis]|uniref:Uncharacterized protein n=1 Tax=Candidatus Brocadia carolinensis TaxID=1004156 RepID=A0A1V4AQ72_9BACT|nr:MAG: hypothetical protein AYP45_15640 [Candidatus Brocadia caroliniensis]
MGNNNNNVEPKRLSANLVDDDLDLIAIKIIRKFRIAIGVIVSSVIVLLSLFGINIIDIGKQAAIYKSESEVLRQDVANIREHVKSINSIIDEAKRLIVTVDNSTIETKKTTGRK